MLGLNRVYNDLTSNKIYAIGGDYAKSDNPFYVQDLSRMLTGI